MLFIVLVVLFLVVGATGSAVLISKAPVVRYANNNEKSITRKFMDSAVSGAISCSVTHSLVVPLDVVKTRMQTDPKLAGMNTAKAFKEVVKSGGRKILLQGLAATSSGYFMQGFCKFGFYDFIKSRINAFVNDDKLAVQWRLPILIASSGLAEVIASWALCPMEVTRIYMVMNPHLKEGMLSAMKEIVKNEGVKGFFKGLPLIMVRQVPYTCAKLAGYDVISERIQALAMSFEERRLAAIETTNTNKRSAKLKKTASLGGVQKAIIQLGSGILAGVLAACISQPADVLLSKVCGGANALSECIIIGGPMDLLRTFQEMGFKQCYTGLQPRAVMIGTLTAMQFLLYEQTKARVMEFKFVRPQIPDAFRLDQKKQVVLAKK